jgi:hypothetical protein
MIATAGGSFWSDEVEDLLYMQGGFNKRGFADGKQ